MLNKKDRIMKKSYILLSMLTVIFLTFITVNRVQAQLYINEFMASNDAAFPGLLNDYADWIEIYNAGNEDIMLGGYFMSDDLADTSSWCEIPSTYPDSVTVPAGGYIIFYANKAEDVSVMCLHFKLSSSGEQIGLWDPDKNVVDTLTFGAQVTDTSYGRYPDGSATWYFMPDFTPGAANRHTTGIVNNKKEVFLSQNQPNPFNNFSKIEFNIAKAQNVVISVFDLTGKTVDVLTNKYYTAGKHSIVWNASNLKAGIYYYKLQTETSSTVKKAMIIR
jgi:hypothetical protein